MVDEISYTLATTKTQHDLDVSLRGTFIQFIQNSETVKPEEVSALICHISSLGPVMTTGN